MNAHSTYASERFINYNQYGRDTICLSLEHLLFLFASYASSSAHVFLIFWFHSLSCCYSYYLLVSPGCFTIFYFLFYSFISFYPHMHDGYYSNLNSRVGPAAERTDCILNNIHVHCTSTRIDMKCTVWQTDTDNGRCECIAFAAHTHTHTVHMHRHISVHK